LNTKEEKTRSAKKTLLKLKYQQPMAKVTISAVSEHGGSKFFTLHFSFFIFSWFFFLKALISGRICYGIGREMAEACLQPDS